MSNLMETYITDKFRVILKRGHFIPFLIQTEQKAETYSYPWEVQEDGWRFTLQEGAGSYEEAVSKYEKQIANERRWH